MNKDEALKLAIDALDSNDPTIQLRVALTLRAELEMLRYGPEQPNTLIDVVARHEKEIQELKRLVTPMMEFKREKWVGLTGDEIEDVNKDQTMWEIIRAAEKILKDKNT